MDVAREGELAPGGALDGGFDAALVVVGIHDQPEGDHRDDEYRNDAADDDADDSQGSHGTHLWRAGYYIVASWSHSRSAAASEPFANAGVSTGVPPQVCHERRHQTARCADRSGSRAGRRRCGASRHHQGRASVAAGRGVAPPTAAEPGPWQFFTPEELPTIEALADRIIPPDPETPGGKDAGCVVFLDRQLAGPYGSAEGLYDRGPFMKGAEQQGPQSAKTPAQSLSRCPAGARSVLPRRRRQRSLARQALRRAGARRAG